MRKLTNEEIFEHAKYTKANNYAIRGYIIYADHFGYLFTDQMGTLRPMGICVPALKAVKE